MRKWRIFLVFAMVFTCLCGCSTQQSSSADATTQPNTTTQTTEAPQVETTQPEKTPSILLAGYAKGDITPDFSVPLAGYGNVNQRMSNNILSRLEASCLALTDEDDSTVLLFALDTISVPESLTKTFRQAITAATGIAGERIMLMASHTHSGPNMTSTTAAMKAYYNEIQQTLCRIAVDALADRLPAQMYTGSIETDCLNFIRHCTYVDSDGTTKYFGNNFGDHVFNDTTTYATEVDPTMHLVKFQREGGQGYCPCQLAGASHPHRQREKI